MNDMMISLITSLVREYINDSDVGYVVRLAIKYPDRFEDSLRDAIKIGLVKPYTAEQITKFLEYYNL